MKNFGGGVVFLDRSDINTDEIIPAKYLTEVKKEALGPHLLEDLEGFDHNKIDGAKVVVTRSNFGCGSSREHAPWALEVNNITMVVAESFARIFRQNMFNCGMMAIELPTADIDRIITLGEDGTICTISLDDKSMTFTPAKGEAVSISFTLAEFDESLVRAGGWVEFADEKY